MNQQQNLENNNLVQSIYLNLIDDTIEQRDFCYSLSFNQDNSILITNNENEILIWNFKHGKMELNQRVTEHSEDVNCLLFSKKNNNFISGSNDKSIRCWKQINVNKWVSSREFEHKSYVYCFFLNKNETQLISGTFNGQINVWHIDFENKDNELKLIQSLDKHNNTVYDLSLNKCETQFISCSRDQTIVVWGLGENQLWEFQYIVINNQAIILDVKFILQIIINLFGLMEVRIAQIVFISLNKKTEYFKKFQMKKYSLQKTNLMTIFFHFLFNIKNKKTL